MTDTPAPADYDDEISIADIVAKIWRGRGLIVLLTVLGVLLGVGLGALLAVGNTPLMQYYISLDGLKNGLYPNDTEFSPQDLMNPAVLSEAARRANINDVVALREVASVEHGSITNQGIVAKYQQQLAQRGLSAAQIDTINQRFADELAGATRTSLRLSIDFRELGLDDEAAKNFLILLPQVWAETYRERFRTLVDPFVQPIAELDQSESNFSLSVVSVAGALDRVSASLGSMARDQRLRSIQTNTGQTATSLAADLREFREIQLSTFFARELENETAEAIAYVESRRLVVEEWNERLEGLDDAISSIRSVMNGAPASRTVDQTDPTGLQVDGAALASIVNLANRTELAAYLRELTEREQNLVEMRANALRELNSFVRARPAPPDRFEPLVARSNEFIAAYNELYTKANAAMNAEYPSFFAPVTSPARTSGYVFPLFVQLVAGMTFVFFALGLILAFLRSDKRP